MRTAPEWFVRQLQREHDGRLRVRWSPARFRWQVEQKVDVARLAPFLVEPEDDDAIRAVDGYARVCEITPGSVTPCSNLGPDNQPCGHDLHIPFGRFVQIKCPKCVQNGFHGGLTVGFFNLDDVFLATLREMDPNRGSYERTRAHLRTANKKLVEMRQRKSQEEAQYAGKDLAALDITKTGYSGKESQWTDAPAPRYFNA